MREQDLREASEVLTLGAETSVIKINNTIMYFFKSNLVPKIHDEQNINILNKVSKFVFYGFCKILPQI